MKLSMANARRHASESLTVVPLAYPGDGEKLFESIRDLPYAAWLDSGFGHGFAEGRYDILTAQPMTVLHTRDKLTEIASQDGTDSSAANPFDLVEAALANLPPVAETEWPFTGGALGYFGYRLNRCLEHLPEGPAPDVGLPDMQVGIYAWAVILDHQQQSANALFLPTVSDHQQRQIIDRLTKSNVKQESNNGFKINKLSTEYKEDYYRQCIDTIQEYIVAGDVYQVNFAQRFKAKYSGDLFRAYRHLRRLLPAPYSAFLQSATGAILSHSPELFLQVINNEVITKPIKGTRPRGQDSQSDQRLITALRESPKDRAENLMIVDLLRNDLGKHCIPGSIRVPELFELRTFENVHHLVSTVTGTLRSNSSPAQLLRDSFPGGSITGAPKIRAMQIISELETKERSVYCGSIGYLSSNGRMTTNVAIRTLAANESHIYAWGGGGIVADSKADAEYQECLDKIGVLLRGLQESG